MIAFARRFDTHIDPLRTAARQWASPLLDLVIRLYMSSIFFKSGWLKFKNFLNHDWGSTIFLFEEAHPIPGIPADIAAIAGTAGEMALPILLTLGLFGRFAAGGLLLMTTMIQFAVPAEYGIMNEMHYLWMLLLAVIVVKGPGAFSLDHLLIKFIRKGKI
jgi:putative oxidoreductase